MPSQRRTPIATADAVLGTDNVRRGTTRLHSSLLPLLDRHDWVSGTMVPRHRFGSSQLFIAWPPRTEPPDAYMTDDVGVPSFLAVRTSSRFFPPAAGVQGLSGYGFWAVVGYGYTPILRI